MVAFVPISPSAARQLLQGICEADTGQFLSAFVEAGRIRAYADVVETLPAGGDPTLGGRIPTALWRRIVAEGKLVQALTLASVKLDGNGLVGSLPAVMITGIRFNADNVKRVAAEHGPTPPIVPSPPVTSAPAAITKKVAKPAPALAGTPPLIEIMETMTPILKPAKAAMPVKVRRGLPADAVTVTIKEACEILDVGRTKLNELMKTDLEVKRIGRSVKIKADSIRAFMGRD